MELWPGFSPTDYPVAVFDGSRTWLSRHPSPPPEFTESPDGWSVEGRHPALSGSSTAIIGGVPTATVLENDQENTEGLVAHETFHLFCQTRHPSWTVDETGAFAWPVTDVGIVALRRLEVEALLRALSERSAAWAATAMELRAKRFAGMSEDAIRFEREVERAEGLALYVQGKVGPIELSDSQDSPRRAAYTTGMLIAAVLDVQSPGWQQELERDDSPWLDSLLRPDQPPAAFSKEDQDDVVARAREGVRALQAELVSLREEFLARDGLVVVSGGPLQVWEFDPMNLRDLGNGFVLHTRFVKLRGPGVSLDVDTPALTESAGAHPLFAGIRRVTIAPAADPTAPPSASR